jgi:hypothetical protein
MNWHFRMLPNRGIEDSAEIRERRSLYEEFLANREFDSNPDLYRFFGRDFFHDGVIDQLAFDGRAGAPLTLRIVADLPVLRSAEARDRVGHSAHAWFRCRFNSLHLFSFVMQPVPTGPQQPVQFIMSEIDTLEDEIRHWSDTLDRPVHSLLVETDPYGSIALVFDTVVVEPEEPLAFHAIQQAGIHDLRLYEPRPRSNKPVQPTRACGPRG